MVGNAADCMWSSEVLINGEYKMSNLVRRKTDTILGRVTSSGRRMWSHRPNGGGAMGFLSLGVASCCASIQLVPYDSVNRNKVSIPHSPFFIFLHLLHVIKNI
jgi:hypothetical protein